MIPGRLSSRREFTPVPSYGSVFVYMCRGLFCCSLLFTYVEQFLHVITWTFLLLKENMFFSVRSVVVRFWNPFACWQHDTTTKCHAGASHTGASSPWFLCRSDIFIPARKLIPVSCKHGRTVRFIFVEVSSILRHYKTCTPINTALYKHGATFHLAPEWKSRWYHVNSL